MSFREKEHLKKIDEQQFRGKGGLQNNSLFFYYKTLFIATHIKVL